jgi:uncharacterized protein
MKINKALVLAAIVAGATSAQAFSVGDIAFTGFNADGTDGYAFATFVDIANGDSIMFTDEEYVSGTSTWATNTESYWTWTANTDIAAGSIVTVTLINDLFSTGAVSNLGTILAGDDGTNNPGFSSTAETVYAFSGTVANPNLLAAISTDASVDFGSLTGGSAIALANGTDGAKYQGPRSGEETFGAYLPLLADVTTNWLDEGGSGTDNYDLTAFETNAVPEPASMTILAAASLIAAARRRRK